MAIFTKPKLLFLFFLILSLFLASQCDDQNPQGQDPRRKLESCLRQCKVQGESPEQQLQCQRSCVLRYASEEGEKSEEVIEDVLLTRPRDPQEKFRECQQRCERQQQGQPRQLCKQRCEQEYKREQGRQHGGRETGEDNQGKGEPEERLRECQQRCQRQEEGQQQRQCQQRCQQEYRREREQEQHRRGQEETRDENQGRGKRDPEERFRACIEWCGTHTRAEGFAPCAERCQQHRGQETTRDENQGRGKRDPEERLRECQQRCQRQEEGQQKSVCQQRCQQEYRREKEQPPLGQETGEEDSNQQKREESNPYLFEAHRWRSGYRTRHGDFRVLEKFTQRSELFKGIEKFRVAVAELEPQSFMVPHHCDGEAIYVVLRGQGTISIANQDGKNSFNLEKGDAIRVPSGSTTYFINRDNNEKLFVYALSKSAGFPGEVRQYFSGGGQNPESFYRAISSDILERSFNIPRDRLDRLFGQHKQGVVVKASEEQIRAISQRASRSTKQTTGETSGPFNVLKERPLFGNSLGQFLVAPPEKFQQLRNLDVAIGFMNINKGAMVIPSINTRVTGLILIVEGSGYFELQCPHLGGQKQEQEEGNVHYQKVGFNVNVGDLVVVPVGHPMTFVANRDSNLRMVSFGLNGQGNQVNFLAGKQSIWSDIEAEAKELSFNTPRKEVEEIFQKQEQSFFVPGPEKHQQRERGEEGKGREQYLSSILDFVF